MPHKRTIFNIDDAHLFKKKALTWATNTFEVVCCLDNNNYTEGLVQSEFECLLAIGVQREIFNMSDKTSFEHLHHFHETNKDWLFGFCSYDLKNELEKLKSTHSDKLDFPNMHFFKPQILLKISRTEVAFLINNSPVNAEKEDDYSSENILQNIDNQHLTKHEYSNIRIKSRFKKKDYLQTVEQLKRHIQQGDIFEINLCQEFFINNFQTDPTALFIALNDIAKAPFSAFYKLKDKYVMCASPERFLKKTGQKLVSQPIKGTSKRGNTEGVDAALKTTLQNDPKNRAENIMIVDLVRNDLGKICDVGTVNVVELCNIYSFPTVHQMISTIEGMLSQNKHFTDALKQTFPMGSMTGAPKVRAMQLIEQYERTRRGVYSGAIGYITPEGDFDFNVVIRSLLYNQKKQYMSFQVGGAIVADSDATAEYAECQLKSQNLRHVLTGKK